MGRDAANIMKVIVTAAARNVPAQGEVFDFAADLKEETSVAVVSDIHPADRMPAAVEGSAEFLCKPASDVAEIAFELYGIARHVMTAVDPVPDQREVGGIPDMQKMFVIRIPQGIHQIVRQNILRADDDGLIGFHGQLRHGEFRLTVFVQGIFDIHTA